jgi:predicted Zn-dependent protease
MNRSRPSRREFVRYVSAGAASVWLSGCATPSERRESTAATKLRPGRTPYSPLHTELVDRAAFRRLADVALEAATAEHALVALDDRDVGTTRFADNGVLDDIRTRQQTLSVEVAVGQQTGRVSTTDLSDEAIRDALRRAEELAKEAAPDPRFMPPLPPQRYPVLPTLRLETAAAGAERRTAEARQAVELCQRAGLRATGSVSTELRAVGLAANNGLFAYEQRGMTEFDVTATRQDSAGTAHNCHRSIDDLGVVAHTRWAIEKATRLSESCEIRPGAYTVVLEPAAVASLLGPMLPAMGAASYHAGASPYAGKLGQQIADTRLTLRNRPDHPALLGSGFDGQGLPSDSHIWFDRGVLMRLDYDRFTAQDHGVAPSYRPDAVHVSAGDATVESIDELVRSIERGILVSDLRDVTVVDPTDLTLTGVTQCGTCLVEEGEIIGRLIALRWRESPLRAFNRIEALTTPREAYADYGKMLVPAMKIRDFCFTGPARS